MQPHGDYPAQQAVGHLEVLAEAVQSKTLSVFMLSFYHQYPAEKSSSAVRREITKFLWIVFRRLYRDLTAH